MEIEGLNIEFLGHATFKIVSDKVIYTDPFQISNSEPADIILITHSHYDHCSPEDIKKIIKKGTIIFVTPDCQSKISKFEEVKIKIVEPNKEYQVVGQYKDMATAYRIFDTLAIKYLIDDIPDKLREYGEEISASTRKLQQTVSNLKDMSEPNRK